MADSYISKIKLANGTVVNLKDAQARADMITLLGGHGLAALGDAAWKALAASISDNDEGLANAKQVKAYVDSMIQTIPEFDVIVVAAGEDLPTASAETFHKIYLKSGGISGSYVEYITIRSGSKGSYTYAWEQVGSLDADFSAYVKKTTKIAGIDLTDDITVAELQSALGLKALAYKDNASGSGTVNTIDTITMNSVTVAGNAAVTHTAANASLTKGDYTPAGSITGSAINGGSINVTVKDAATASEATLTRGDYTPAGSVTMNADNDGAFQVGGTNAASEVTFTPADDTFVKSLKAGNTAAASFTEGAFTPASIAEGFFSAGSQASYSHTGFSGGSFTKGSAISAATEGVVASVGTGDDAETLIFTAAQTDDVMDYDASYTAAVYGTDTFVANTLPSIDTTKFDGGSKAADHFAAEKLPVVDATASALTGLSNVQAAAQVFTGNKYAPAFTGTKEAGLKVTKAEYLKQEIDDAEFNGTAATLGFSGTKAENVLVTGVSYDKADATAAFSETVTPTVNAYNRTAKTVNITVS